MSKVNLTIAFDSVDEALVALAAFSQVKVKPGVAADKGGATAPAATSPAPQDAKPPRKPRADRGQPRGPYNKDSKAGADATAADTGGASSGQPTAPVEGAASAAGGAVTDPSNAASQPATSTSTPEASAAAAPGNTEPAEYTDQQLQDKLSAVFSKGAQLAIDTLSRFGVTRLKDLAKEHRAEFAALCDKVVAGGQP